jgi:hypothetical protein
MAMLAYQFSSSEGNKTKVTVKTWDGKFRSQVFNVERWMFQESLRNYRMGALIQEAFHYLTPSEREFMMTGMTDDEFPKEDDGQEIDNDLEAPWES